MFYPMTLKYAPSTEGRRGDCGVVTAGSISLTAFRASADSTRADLDFPQLAGIDNFSSSPQVYDMSITKGNM